jgi:hypothetical protein
MRVSIELDGKTAGIVPVLRRQHWNVASTAWELGVTRESVIEMLGTLDIRRPPPRWHVSEPCRRCGAVAGEPCRIPMTAPQRSRPGWERSEGSA